MASVTREDYVKDLGQITAWLSKVEATVGQTRSESAALSRAAAETDETGNQETSVVPENEDDVA